MKNRQWQIWSTLSLFLYLCWGQVLQLSSHCRAVAQREPLTALRTGWVTCDWCHCQPSDTSWSPEQQCRCFGFLKQGSSPGEVLQWHLNSRSCLSVAPCYHSWRIVLICAQLPPFWNSLLFALCLSVPLLTASVPGGQNTGDLDNKSSFPFLSSSGSCQLSHSSVSCVCLAMGLSTNAWN